MEIQITKEKETPLLSRKRMTAWVNYQGATPSRKEVLKEFAKTAKAKPQNTIIKHMYTRFGQTDMKVIAHVYSDEGTLQRLESKNLIEKNKVEESKKATKQEATSEKQAEGAKEEKEQPAEETKKEPEKKEEAQKTGEVEQPAEEETKE